MSTQGFRKGYAVSDISHMVVSVGDGDTKKILSDEMFLNEHELEKP